MTEIQKRLFDLQDEGYRDFNGALIPTVERDKTIGVRTPELRKLAKELSGTKEAEDFLTSLPHEYFDENQLHAFLLERVKDYDACLAAVERFLPYVDNWATCDQLNPKVFKKHKGALLGKIREWIASGETYTARFGMGMLMAHYLEEDFRPEYLEWVASVRSEEYYIRMMQAWYFATALAKQYEAALPYIRERRLEPWTHNKAIQKAVESRRISEEQKTVLRSLKQK